MNFMNFIELTLSGVISALVAVGGAFLGARLTLSTYDKQEKRRLKIHTLRRFKGRMHSEARADALNEIPATFNDSAKVKEAFGEAYRSITAKRERK